MGVNYAYKYALVRQNNGMCYDVRDSSVYYLDPTYIPIPEYNANYLMKYYYPIPETVESFDDFQGQWYSDAAHTIPWSPEA